MSPSYSPGLVVVLVFLILPAARASDEANDATGSPLPSYPRGDIRNCPTHQLQDSSIPLHRMDALPGLGFDNLRNIDTGMVYERSFSECSISSDGTYLLPDGIYLIPILQSEVDSYASIYDHFNDWKSQTSTSINLDFSYSGFSKISGKFSADFQNTKEKMTNTKSKAVQIGLKYHLYSVHINPDAKLNEQFKSRLLDIAANIQNNNTKLAHYFTELLVRDYGTHVVTSVDAGASLSQTSFVYSSFIGESMENKVKVAASASASFFGSFKISASVTHTSDTSSVDNLHQSTTHAHTTAIGGPPLRFGNFTLSEWEDNILDHLVPIDRSGQPLYTAISSANVPELPDFLLDEVLIYVYKAIQKYYKVNTHYGCTDPTSPGFNFQANINDDSCDKTHQNYTFGGIYQICSNTVEDVHNVCGDFGAEQTNPLTGGPSCPAGYTDVLLHTGSLIKAYPQSVCHQHCSWWSCHNDCHSISVAHSATYEAHWCAHNPEQRVPADQGYLFGGVYTSKSLNPVTGAKTCPMFFYPLHFGEDIEVCVSNDAQGFSMSLPFGGFDSCTSGNALAASGSQFESSIYPHACPTKFSQFLVTIDEGCIINYCSYLPSFKTQPPKLPPYNIKAGLSAANTSNTLVIQGPSGKVWMKSDNGTWQRYTGDQYTAQQYLITMSMSDLIPANNTTVPQAIAAAVGGRQSHGMGREEVAGIVIGTFIGTLIFVGVVIAVGSGVFKVRKRHLSNKKGSYREALGNNNNYSSINIAHQEVIDFEESVAANI